MHISGSGRGMLVVLPQLMALTFMMLTTLSPMPALAQSLAPRIAEFTLGNGMQVVVIPDTRAPVVTHFVWYRVGSADEPRGVSGIAHFLEHLMFKSTEKMPSGEFSKIVSRLGGQDNAFTSYDMTAYYQRISKDRLPRMMEMEADRMVNLKLDAKDVLTERAVIIEERRSRTENNPSSILAEQMSAMLYQNHPYRIPIIGWMHEMEQLSREDALVFYKRHYAPNNAILVVAGDVTPEEVRTLADATYGKIAPNPEIRPRVRPQEPPARAPRRVELKDPRAGNASVRRYYIAPAYRTAQPGEAEALHVMMKIAGQGATSRIYQRLVAEEKVASSAGGWYSGSSLDSGSIGLYAVAAQGASLEKVEASLDAVLHELRTGLVTQDELERAKKAYIADFIYEADSQSALARRYGEGLVIGQSIQQINDWPNAIAKVTAEDVKRVADKYLDIRASVTGTLIPVPPEAEAGTAPKQVMPASTPGRVPAATPANKG
ncbi:MAG: pitrilysin family protein [Hyphomicrobiaceae bacterium]|nr:pitrilysin family protein [Hyphomicrobiaceae bacterium]